jgi:RNA recognition motif-containing protein
MHGHYRHGHRAVVDLSPPPPFDGTPPVANAGRRAIFVANLPINATEDDVCAFFEQVGAVENLKLRADNRERQLFATIVFQYAQDAKRAISSPQQFRGRILGLAYAR